MILIAAELKFVYFLVYKEIERISQSDADGALFYLEKRKAFLGHHLGMWALDFVKDMEKNAETSVYKNLARATGAFLRSDLEVLAGIVPAEKISEN